MWAAVQEVICNVELAYEMSDNLKSAMKEAAATSVVLTLGQRVFLHSFDCKGTDHCPTLHQPFSLQDSQAVTASTAVLFVVSCDFANTAIVQTSRSKAQ